MEINWLAVVAASLAMFVIGAVWFMPKTFYPVWMKAQGRKVPNTQVEMSAGSTVLMFGGTFVGTVVQAVTLAIVINLAQTVDPTIGAVGGAAIGALLGFGIGAASSFSHRQFSQADHNQVNAVWVWVLEVGQDITSLTVAGLIIGSWL
jgi:preprotein translocase subunit YajC